MTMTNDQQVAEILARGVARVKARGIAERDPVKHEQDDSPAEGSIESPNDDPTDEPEASR